MKRTFARFFAVVFACMVVVTGLTACEPAPTHESSDQTQRRQQEQLQQQANSSVGMPAVNQFSEKRALKDIYELRDKMSPTITYTQDMNGRLHKLCDSVGFGIPYATQFTNPQKIAYAEHQVGVITLPQADPNGLFSPAAADGTWILCVNPKTGKAAPLYVEPHVIVSEFALPNN